MAEKSKLDLSKTVTNSLLKVAGHDFPTFSSSSFLCPVVEPDVSPIPGATNPSTTSFPSNLSSSGLSTHSDTGSNPDSRRSTPLPPPVVPQFNVPPSAFRAAPDSSAPPSYSVPLTSSQGQGLASGPLTSFPSQGLSTPLSSSQSQELASVPLTSSPTQGHATPPTSFPGQGHATPPTSFPGQGLASIPLTSPFGLGNPSGHLSASSQGQGLSSVPLTSSPSQGFSVPLTSSSSPLFSPNLPIPTSTSPYYNPSVQAASTDPAADDLSHYFNNCNLASNLTTLKAAHPPPLSDVQSPAGSVLQASSSAHQSPLPPPLAPPQGSAGNNYRLGKLKKTAYAQVPGLATVSTNCAVAAPLPLQSPLSPPPTLSMQMQHQQNQQSQQYPSVATIDGTTSSIPLPPSAPASIMSPTPVEVTDGAAFSAMAQGFEADYNSSNFNSPNNNPSYRPVYQHWFFKRDIEGKTIWYPFSMADSLNLESAFCSSELNVNSIVPTDGGRYDVEILRRQRTAVFWKEEPAEVRRCSWFSKNPGESRQMPYEENVATKLEEEYKQAVLTGTWSRRITLPNEDEVVMHSPTAIVHNLKNSGFSNLTSWDSNPPGQLQPRIVKRGLDEFNIADGEPEKADHLLFLVHGIGSFCDLKFRPVTEVVDDFRNISLQLTQSHFRGAIEQGIVNRIEVLPVSWHDVLHSSETGIDRKLQSITLASIPKLRHFTNDTLLDILFYTSPVFCETIVQAVGNELNRIYKLYCSRNPHFRGGVSVGGHSLGSLILFDMLCNQLPVGHPMSSSDSPNGHKNGSHDTKKINLGCLKTEEATLNNDVSYVTIGRAGTGQPYIKYPQLEFQPAHFFGFGAPIGMFITIRGISSLGPDFKFPTCSSFFNIFHPFDPVAYRIEPLILPEMEHKRPVLIPHHKGRKRMHLELRDTMAHVGAALKSTIYDSMRNTLNTVYQLAGFNKPPDDASIEQQVTQALQKELSQDEDPTCQMHYDNDELDETIRVGLLNNGRRIDYVLQEAPLESFNEYLFALSSHVCYWESEDTMLLVLKEIYSYVGACVDNQVPTQTLPFDIPDGQAGPQQVPSYVPNLESPKES